MKTKPKSPVEKTAALAETKGAPSLDERLDDELDDSFPASDPPTVTRDPAPAGPADAGARKGAKPR
jgi:hypothetical protein